MVQMRSMDTQHASAPKRTRRSAEQWQEILKEHREGHESSQQLADRLGCKLSTIEMQLKRLQINAKDSAGRFVEVEAKRRHGVDDATVALTLQTASGVVVTFTRLPPPDYLAAALRLAH